MATYNDLASVLNNPGGLSLADALAQRNASVSLPTLAEEKAARLNEKLALKQQKFDPNPQPAFNNFLDPYASTTTSNTDSTGLADLAEASLYRAGGNLADAGRGVSNYLFDTNFDDSEASGWSNSALADEQAGVSLAYRQNLQQDQDQVLQDVVDGNWWDATKSAGNVAFRTAADSFATAPELAAGAVLTPVAGAGLGVIGRRIQKASETAANIAKRYEEIKDNKALSLGRKALTETGRASVLTADIVQQQRNEYKAENNGEEPSAKRLAGMTALTLATTIWQPQIASKLFIKPKIGKTTKADGNFRERFQKEIQAVVDTADRGVMNNLGRRIYEGAKGLLAAGGAEAVQEYGQFWAETLGTKMKPDEATSFFQAAMNEFANEDNQNRAIQSAFLGGAAGGATKLAMSTPEMAVKATVDTGLSAAGSVSRAIENQVTDALSDTDILAMSAEDQSRKRAADTYTKRAEDAAATLNAATNISDIADESLINEMTSVANGRDLNDADIFNSVKDSVIRKVKAEATTAQLSVTGKRAVNISKKALTAAKERAEKFAEDVLTPERIQQVKNFSEETKTAIVNELENFPQSTTAGLIEAAGQYTTNKTKEGLSKLREQAQASGATAANKLADILEKNNPEEAKDVIAALRESAKKQSNAAKQAGIRKDALTTEKNLSENIRTAASIGIKNSNDLDQVMSEIFDVSKGEFDSEATVNQVIMAANNVRNSPDYKALPLEERRSFQALESNLKRKFAKQSRTTTEKASAAVNKAVSKGVDAFSKAIDIAVPKGTSNQTNRDRVVKALNDAFVKFTTPRPEPLLLTDQRKVTPDTIAVREDPTNPKSRVVATIQKHPDLENLKGALVNAQNLLDEGDATTINVTADSLTDPTTIELIANVVGSRNPAVVQSLFNYFAPSLAEPEFANKIKQQLESQLATTPENQNASTANSGQTQSRQTSETTQNAPSDQKAREKFDQTSVEELNSKDVKTVDEDTVLQEGEIVSVSENGKSYFVSYVTMAKDDDAFLNDLIPLCKD